ncbi:hypothetical protein [Pseudogemmobacter faecipullorum]|uniref:Uncharacterized protein n=1 Tax=Pseudogemmobacter faecipullorum TaxID=2755041 RepID=A0ABS8CIF8_9RHOB|nr:hypothetical protein [Pseudogemmobacter faecipullorum]MCB5409165.1 hypothetical protein [Pseudogemmobacter faecipullorum]
MVLSNAEKVRRYRERQKQKLEEESRLTSTGNDFKRPFWLALGNELSSYQNDFYAYFEQTGIDAPEFTNDDGPEAFAPDHYPANQLAEIFPDLSNGSLRRVEEMIGSLKEATETLAGAVNHYKRNEIKARLAEIEASDLSEPEAKKAALKEAARLNKMLDQLDKQVRITFPQWKVTG